MAKIERWLSHGAVMGLWTFTLTEFELNVDYPILLELLDSDSKKSRSRREQDAIKTRLELEKSRVEKKENKNITADAAKATPTEKSKDSNKKVWEAYKECYMQRYKIEPARNAMVNKQISNLVKRLGEEDAINIVKFYLSHNDSFYLKNTHSIGLCLNNAESLYTQMKRNKQITQHDIKKFESKQNEREIFDAIAKGEI